MKILFLGSRPDSIFFYKNLNKNHIVYVLKTSEINKWYYNDINNLKEVKFIEKSKLKNINFNIGISYNYNKKIKNDLLKIPLKGFINIHYSYNLKIRGRNIMFYSIYKNLLDTGFSFHWMNENIDSGKIIYSEKILPDHNSTSEQLYEKINKRFRIFSKKFIKNLDHYISLDGYDPPSNYKYFSISDFNQELRKISSIKKIDCKKKQLLIRALKFRNYNKKQISYLNTLNCNQADLKNEINKYN